MGLGPQATGGPYFTRPTSRQTSSPEIFSFAFSSLLMGVGHVFRH